MKKPQGEGIQTGDISKWFKENRRGIRWFVCAGVFVLLWVFISMTMAFFFAIAVLFWKRVNPSYSVLISFLLLCAGVILVLSGVEGIADRVLLWACFFMGLAAISQLAGRIRERAT